METKDILILDDTNWEKAVEKGKKPVVVMFSSPTCPYCKQMEPHFIEYSSEFKDKIIFAQVDILNSPTIASRYGVMSTPTFKFFCQGRPVNEIVGAVYPSILKKAVEDSLIQGPECINNTTLIDPGITGYV